MNQETVLEVLSGRDYQMASAIISWLNNCQTKDEFNQVMQIALLPLIACNGAFYGRLAGEHCSLQLLGSINQSTCCPHGWQQFLNSTLQKATAGSSIEDISNALSAVTMSSNIVPCTGNTSCQNQSFNPLWQQSHHKCTAITLFDDHHLVYRLCFCRLDAQQQIFNQRDIELLKLLQPILLQTLRFIMFREESLHPRQTLTFWSDNTEPVVVIRNDGVILFQSQAFVKVIGLEHQSFLSTALNLIQFVQSNQIGWYSLLSKIGQRLYEIKLTLVYENAGCRQCICLLHLSRVANKNGKIFNRLNRTGLTNRELEIAALIFQGNSPKEIAEEISLSYHTVRNHIKSIYSKLGVSTRSEMLVKLV